ncbi:Trans-acting regulatory protein hvrA [Candidatus Burkholderia verschuerenii]|uniref:Trans-acting regulatory protein hvrA n=1 Tax=Candidatus Burkholderia verschuerenii TaxID=242163 RepID=A0A0L0MEA7_9BURK|nr:H-NS histone family protein [Candidatus Burkholderia verschuerenii]KND60590.1 Trans-acting regulatory protein hvrA [Candidatus Burkholderia verschuerenii]
MSSTGKQQIASSSPFDLGKMSDQELADLRQEIETEWKKRESRQKRDARKQIVELAKQHDIDLSSLADTNVKYRDPENQFNTWNGRGRKPEWIRKALEKGVNLDDLKS